MKRRDFISGSLIGTAGIITGSCGKQKPAGEKRKLFSFIHFTDIHVQPEQGAPEGFLKAIDKMNSLNPDFAISGGDLVMDALAVDEERANRIYDIYIECCKNFQMPVYDVIGNHEVFGITAPDIVSPNHPDWGKELFKRRLGNGLTYRSFDHKNVHFVLLDSVGIEKNEQDQGHQYIGEIGAEQLEWLKSDLSGIPSGTPVIAVTHIPYLTLYYQIIRTPNFPNGRSSVLTDGKELYNLFMQHHVLGILEGHIHVNEIYQYKTLKIIDTAAVCGAWWDGPRDGHPEGFNLVQVFEDEIISEYITYGWDASRYNT